MSDDGQNVPASSTFLFLYLSTHTLHLFYKDLEDPETMALPHYLQGHVDLGYDSDDLTAFIDAIEASQRSADDSSALPHMPPEIILLVLESVPIDYILDFRLVCKAFRDHIDGPVLHSYLPATDFHGPVTHRRNWTMYDKAEDLIWLHGKFSGLRPVPGTGSRRMARWDAYPKATFKIDRDWIATNQRSGRIPANPSTEYIEAITKEKLQLSTPKPFRAGWLVRLGHFVFDAHPIYTATGEATVSMEGQDYELVDIGRRSCSNFSRHQ
ncbi:hypothetical protein M011DRAFT_479451 [Sporormia fimetaria CBS 119925]|uniref:F-box domain-containing protein n=1 Tax=Sporormia fimetaria CBS 119925 TaxID=1340428 RepID=A0A6A6V3B9_9PLEO|nr:hypothetical protein M011DRAFT_479451 [Sporormia fimetaria CBS 119925]